MGTARRIADHGLYGFALEVGCLRSAVGNPDEKDKNQKIIFFMAPPGDSVCDESRTNRSARTRQENKSSMATEPRKKSAYVILLKLKKRFPRQSLYVPEC